MDRTQVAEAALRLLNETGLEQLSLRRIATELNVKAPALYWHFASKQALLDEMATVMTRELRDHAAPASGTASWDEWFAENLRLLRRTLLRYRDGAKVFSGTRLTTTEHAEGQERYLRMMTEAGFSVNAAARAFFTAFSYTVGFVIEEQAVQPLPDERAPGYDPDERAARMAAHPLAAQISAELFTDFDARFEEGLQAVIAGLRATVLAADAGE
ncbi:TetR/AcrR family transcriptional regulator C-terminal domain-containing protein [Streptomyces qinglanensis]|uniref:TetR/AcrR family transcriptional regulator C-terminal domain-containing protein n=1 Tax=Streptomyces qinglanensis TaxID=943816 RepID=UPI0037BB910F